MAQETKLQSIKRILRSNDLQQLTKTCCGSAVSRNSGQVPGVPDDPTDSNEESTHIGEVKNQPVFLPEIAFYLYIPLLSVNQSLAVKGDT